MRAFMVIGALMLASSVLCFANSIVHIICYNGHIKRLFQSNYLPGLIPKFTHVHEYKEGVDDFSVFDISACYAQSKQVERVVFSLPGIVI